MINLSINLQNCYGIPSLDYEFKFANQNHKGRRIEQAYAIYAPNGLMKTSFAKTFTDLATGWQPKEERADSRTECNTVSKLMPVPTCCTGKKTPNK